MEVKKLTVNQVKNLVSNVKAIYHLNGFVTGKRTNLQKATKECKCDYAELGKRGTILVKELYKSLKRYLLLDLIYTTF